MTQSSDTPPPPLTYLRDAACAARACLTAVTAAIAHILKSTLYLEKIFYIENIFCIENTCLTATTAAIAHILQSTHKVPSILPFHRKCTGALTLKIFFFNFFQAVMISFLFLILALFSSAPPSNEVGGGVGGGGADGALVGCVGLGFVVAPLLPALHFFRIGTFVGEVCINTNRYTLSQIHVPTSVYTRTH
jgi:hypothetical protein